MLKRKYMIIGFLTLCLTATLFIDISTSGNQNGISNTTYPAITSTSEYDPWVDINEDGIIDLYDLVKLGIRYGTTGNPTRTVYINHSTYVFDEIVHLEPAEYDFIDMTTKGFRQVTIALVAIVEIDVHVSVGILGCLLTLDSYTGVGSLLATFDVQGDWMRFQFSGASASVDVHFQVYMTT